MDLGLNQCKIKEIKYEVKNGKIAIFKFENCNIADIDIVENNAFIDNIKDEARNKPKELHDYKPISCFGNDKVMEKILDTSREKKWKNFNIEKPVNIESEKVDDETSPNDSSKATAKEISEFAQKIKDKEFENELKAKYKYKKEMNEKLDEAKKLIAEHYVIPIDAFETLKEKM